MSATNDLFLKGKEGYEQKKAIDKANKERKSREAYRFWLNPGEESTLVFLDTEGVYVNEHQFETATGGWNNYSLCTARLGSCTLCDSGNKAKYIAYYSVLDTREITSKDGTKKKNRKLLFPAKYTMIDILEDIKKENKSLTGLAIKVKRYVKTDPNSGVLATVVKRVDLKKIKEDTEPFDYEKVLVVLSKKELDGVNASTAPPMGSKADLASGSGETSPDSDDELADL